MADIVGEPVTAEGETSACQTIGVSEDQPPLKRRKPREYGQRGTIELESRLTRVLSCSVCLDLPFGPVYQVREIFTDLMKTQNCGFAIVIRRNLSVFSQECELGILSL